MSWSAALALAIGLALFAAASGIGLAKTQSRTPDTHHVAPLRAADAADQLAPAQIGHDDQWVSWLVWVPRIRRLADAETQATEGERS